MEKGKEKKEHKEHTTANASDKDKKHDSDKKQDKDKKLDKKEERGKNEKASKTKSTKKEPYSVLGRLRMRTSQSGSGNSHKLTESSISVRIYVC